MFHRRVLLLLVVFFGTSSLPIGAADDKVPKSSKSLQDLVDTTDLWAGVAKVEITNKKVIPANDPLYVKALVLKNGAATAVLVTVDAVAIAEIGYIPNEYLGKVRARLQKELNIHPAGVMINASHCHGVVCADVDDKTFQAVKQASESMVPVTAGTGVGFENRIMENRRLKLKNGK